MCRACHIGGIGRSTFYAVSGYIGVKHHLLNVHKVDANGKKVAEGEIRHNPFKVRRTQLGNRDFSKQQPDLFADAYSCQGYLELAVRELGVISERLRVRGTCAE